MAKLSFIRNIKFYTQDLLADALMSLIFLIMCIGVSGLFLVASADHLYLYFMCFLLIVPAAVLFLLRRLNIPVIPMIFLHLAVAVAVPLLFSGMGIAVLLVTAAASAALVIYSILIIFSKNASHASPSLLLLSFFIHLFCLFLSSMRGDNSLTPFLTSGFLISVCLYLAVRQIFSFKKGFDHFQKSPTQPGRAIQVNNNRIILLLCIVTAIIFPLSIVFPYDLIADVFKLIGRSILKILAFLIGLLPVSGEENQDMDPEYMEGRRIDESRMSTGILSDVLEYVSMFLFIFVVVYGLYRVLPAIIDFLRKHSRIRHGTANRERSQYITDETIDLDRFSHRRNKKLPAFGTGEERKVRKEYYREVREAIAKGAAITGASSAEEIKNTIFDQFGKDISELTARYEKVRYGPRSQSHTGRSSRNR